MQRRTLIKGIGLLATGAIIAKDSLTSENNDNSNQDKSSLRIAHITDVHLRPEYNAPDRYHQCIELIKKHEIDFVLNTGDSIYAADYDNITRERVSLQWELWKKARTTFKEYEMFSCLGNHDMWWAAPEKSDAMYGKEFVVKQLEIPHRYYSFNKKSWHFIALDSNNEKAGSLDSEQRDWLEKDLASLPAESNILIMSHYPILAACTHIDGGNHTDSKYIADLFYRHRNKKIKCISGHIHLLDHAWYNDVQYFCNGALSGFWWEPGDKESAGRGWYHQTPPGYAIIDLYDDGTIQNKYYPVDV